MTVRRLVVEDLPALDVFLRRHADGSLFLRSNLRAVGIADGTAPYHATYVAALDGERVEAVAAHCWNGNVLLQAPSHAGEVATAVVAATGRQVTGVLGPWAQLVAARAALGLDDRRAAFESHDDLFALATGDLAVPPPLATGRVRCRPLGAGEAELATAWRVAYRVELLGGTDGPDLRTMARAEIELLQRDASAWLLEYEGVPVAFSAFNARVPDVVQIGGVYTPPALRGHGYARSVVAGSLLAVRAHGVRRSILFTGQHNEPARRAYLALGYRIVGDYGLVLFTSPDAGHAATT